MKIFYIIFLLLSFNIFAEKIAVPIEVGFRYSTPPHDPIAPYPNDMIYISTASESFSTHWLSPELEREYSGYDIITIISYKPSSCGFLQADLNISQKASKHDHTGGMGGLFWRFIGRARITPVAEKASATVLEYFVVNPTIPEAYGGNLMIAYIVYTVAYEPFSEVWTITFDKYKEVGELTYFNPETGKDSAKFIGAIEGRIVPYFCFKDTSPTMTAIIFTDGPPPTRF